ncbi:AbrB/MazE/SpoVT family DNA-binding domain-containing protein [Paracoccus denitrificans]|jgi:AbrB family looped-hinge helix DNA binding protein|uniref:AbrB/MazE/SpoVT family DNA-binding domain-containing protein n=1 Tax=Paracoccus denitrificans TaxID=266 RepID=UPI00336520AF
MAQPDPLITTVSTKGQVILPKAIRQRRDWDAGTRLVVEETPEGVLLKRAPAFAPTRPENVFGMLPFAGEPKSLEDMEAGVLAEARRRHDRD